MPGRALFPLRDTARAMSQDNVAIVRRLYEGVTARLEIPQELFDPDFELDQLDAGVEVVEEGDDVVALVHLTGRGKASGVEVDVRFYARVKVRDGKIAYVYDHEDRDAALEAAGLTE